MRVVGDQVVFATQHREVESVRKDRSARVWLDAPTRSALVDTVTLSTPQSSTPTPDSIRSSESSASGEAPKLMVTRLLLEALTGEKLRPLSPPGLQATAEGPDLPSDQSGSVGSSPKTDRAGWGGELRSTTVRTECEETVVSAQGTVRTADGREFGVAAELRMSREFIERTDVTLALGDAAIPKDPLVLNLSRAPASLSGRRVSLDLEGDGQQEALPFVGQGSAFLVADRNANGVVDNGTELFGPTRGNGFDELSALDADGNGWIDEADPGFTELRLWALTADGVQTLETLAEGGVGALCLSRVQSPFSLKGSDNQLEAQVCSTGIYLREDGNVGTVQQLDLVV